MLFTMSEVEGYMENQIQKNYNITLDIIRVMACAGVFCTHIWQIYGVEGKRIYDLLGRVCHAGTNGVVVLFCLSGYLAWYGMDRKQFDQKSYYKNRLLRLSPAYFIVLAAYLVVGFMPLKIGILRYFTYTNGIIPSHDYGIYNNNQGGFWTMSCFAVFYLICPFLKKYITNLKRAITAMTCIFLFGKLFDFILHPVLLTFNADKISQMEVIFPIGNMYFFIMGVVAYYALKEKKENIIILAAMALISIFLMIEKIDYSIWCVIAAILIILSERIVIKTRTSSIPTKLIRTGSQISYEVYLSHCFFIELLKRVELPLEPLIIFGMTIAASFLLHFLAEQVYRRG